MAPSSAAGNSRKECTLSPTVDESVPLLGEKARALIACNQKLQELGINNTITLPRICVIGDQSTGKSSLIEAISTIKVPKAKGCCTQCPLAINLSNGANATSPWTCTISIEEHYEFDESLVSKGVTKNNPFGPWQKRAQMKVHPVKTTSQKDEVPDLIEAAQSAVINPGTKFQDYLGANARRRSINKTPQFSPNVIRVDVSEGDWANLSFIDLPGVIANTGKEKDKWLVKLIRNLVQRYASADRSVNMLTLPMTHDIENSQACAIVQDLRAEQNTLAVFTKADLVDSSQQVQFIRKFVGEDDLGFQHGYHFVVMPDNLNHDAARVIEAETFAKEPWSLMDPQYRSRLGVDNLRLYLRHLLFQKTAETLPTNLKSIETRLAKVDEELSLLPPPATAMLLPLQLQTSVTEFENAMKSLFSGNSGSTNFSARALWKQNMLRFRANVVNFKPTVFLMTDVERKRLKKARIRAQGLQSTDALEVSSDEGGMPTHVKSETKNRDEVDRVCRFHLENIRDINERHCRTCVSGEIEISALEEMFKLSVQYWHELLQEFMDGNSRLLNKQILEVTDDIFGGFAHLEVLNVIRSHVENYVHNAMSQEWTQAEVWCNLEQMKPMTYDVENLKEREEIIYKERVQKRDEKRLLLADAELDAAKGVSKQKTKKNEIRLEPDPYKSELLMSAKCKAYYEIASTRFVDNICLGIWARLIPDCTEKLVEDLKDHLGLKDVARHPQIVEWMTEDSLRERKRRDLILEKERLTEGLSYIGQALGPPSARPTVTSKRRSSGSPAVDDEPKTPSKRNKTAHTNNENTPTQTRTPGRLANEIQSIELDD